MTIEAYVWCRILGLSRPSNATVLLARSLCIPPQNQT